jgi:hypothetical protein
VTRYALNPKAEAMVEAIAERTAEILAERYGLTTPAPTPVAEPTPALVDANEIARITGLSRDSVYRKAEVFEAQKVPGPDKKPRLRFNPDRVLEIIAGDTRPPSPTPPRASVTPSHPKPAVPLLPIAGKDAA